MRVVIAEDLALLRDGLQRLLRDNGFEVVAAVGDGARSAARSCAPSGRTSRSSTSGCRPTSATRACGRRSSCGARRPSTAVLMVSQYVEQTYAAELLGDGRGGDRLPAQGPHHGRGRLRRGGAAGRRRRHRARPRGGRAARLDAAARTARSSELTPREREVLELMAEGRSNAGIAEALVLTVGAVEKHIASIFGKLDLHPVRQRPPARAGRPRVPQRRPRP